MSQEKSKSNKQLIEAWLNEAVDAGGLFRSDYVERRGWKVVPEESGLHFDEGDMQGLARASEACGVTQLFARLTEQLGDVPEFLDFAATVDSINEFNLEYGHFNLVLWADTGDFSVICSTTEDYLLYAGAEEVLELATGEPYTRAWELFEEYVSWASDTSEYHEVYEEIIKRYKAE
ncbi:MAG: hypothetical protein H6830_06075 [Planctomycetes bacterium]|nr:hypothetical protein [Planctomycetota bacterium]MCB9911663.1 hypothetical protein [Planctomycetota bacterium]